MSSQVRPHDGCSRECAESLAKVGVAGSNPVVRSKKRRSEGVSLRHRPTPAPLMAHSWHKLNRFRCVDVVTRARRVDVRAATGAHDHSTPVHLGLLLDESEYFVDGVPPDERVCVSMEPYPARLTMSEQLGDPEFPPRRAATTVNMTSACSTITSHARSPDTPPSRSSTSPDPDSQSPPPRRWSSASTAPPNLGPRRGHHGPAIWKRVCGWVAVDPGMLILTTLCEELLDRAVRVIHQTHLTSVFARQMHAKARHPHSLSITGNPSGG